MDWVALARSRHITRAFFLALLMGGFLIWWKLIGNPGPVESEHEVAGVVEVVYEKALTVRLETGQKVKLYRKGNPAVGTPVRLSVTRFANGDETYVLMETGTY